MSSDSIPSPRSHSWTRLIAIAALAFALVALFVVPTRQEPTWSVVSWNMEWFPSGFPEALPAADEAERVRTAAKAIRDARVPDIFIAQEIRDAETCTNLCARIGDPTFVPTVCSDFWYNPTNRCLQQVAIFSRFPAVATGFVPWTSRDFIFPPRGYTWAVLDTDSGLLGVFGVHLKSNYVAEGQDPERQAVLNRLKRELSADQLIAHIDRMLAEGIAGTNLAGVIVAGDFNTGAEDERFAEERTMQKFLERGFRDVFEGIPEKDRPTLPADGVYPDATFDHIYYLGLEAPLARSVGQKCPVSDHLPIRAKFRATKTQSAQ